MRFRIVTATLVGLALAGCQSEIATYDSTFTGKSAYKNYKSSFVSTGAGFRDRPFKSAFGRNYSKTAKTTSKAKTKNLAKPYFVEFRARSALTYGHVAVVFGKLTPDGKLPVNKNGVLDPKKVQITGLHPATPSSVPWSVGHVVPVPAETGPSDGDFEEKYVAARYRVKLTKTQFNKLVRIVAKHKHDYKLWYAPVLQANCIGYAASIAKEMGLKTPTFAAMPKDYILKMKKLNTRT